MIEKTIDFDIDAREGLLSGINQLANAVKTTLGAAGNTVILEDDFGRPHITKDGVTVAKSINLSNPVEHLGATVLKQASIKTADIAGDGTTTSIVLAQELINTAFKQINDSINVTRLRNELDLISQEVIAYISLKAKKVDSETLADVATISANNDRELGEMIASAYNSVGVDGAVTIEESMTRETYTEIIEGTRIKKGYHSPYMITDTEKNTAVLENPYVLVSDKKINTIEDIEPILKEVLVKKRSLLIISDIETAVMNTLNRNKAAGILTVNVVSPEGVGLNRFELLEDLAIMTGAVVISDETGNDFTAVTSDFLGEAKKAVSSDRETVIALISEKTADAVKERAEMVRNILKKKEDAVNEWHYKDRLSRLAGGIAAIHVGAVTEVEMKEKKDRVEDAIHATRAALEEGIVAGGGIALYNASQKVMSIHTKAKNKERKAAAYIMAVALRAPLIQILENASYSLDDFETKLDKVRRQGYGLDVRKLRFGNMFDMGIIDPLKVTKNAISNATSVAITILTTNCVVSNKRA